jgi:predicted RNase H-like HicB family nuclease
MRQVHHYVAIVHKDENSDFGLSFPDFPGCITAGGTLKEAVAMAIEALSGHIELMIDDGLAIPEPTDIDTILLDPDNREGVPVMVPAVIMKPAKAVRVNVTLPEDVLRHVDEYAESHGFTRSGFLARAAQAALGEKDAGAS